MTIFLLTLREVLEIHKDEIQHYGGAFGVRDKELLISALAQPWASFSGQYLHKDLFEMGSAYLYHICQNHPFIDGNKRTALAVALMFFLMNGIEIKVDSGLLADMVFKIAKGRMKKKSIATWFCEYSSK
ncbi:MAG: Toxin Doc [Candidatus Anoxychlamydiales bacterium]|nr:Toxin Doc [Candidatus Anoxychlamydiales bacterium]